MSGPNSLQAQIAQLQAQQQIQEIQGRQPAILPLLNRFNEAEAANLEAARELPGDVYGQVQEFCRRMGQVAAAGTTLRTGVLPMPRSADEMTSFIGQYSYNSGLIQASFKAKQDIVDSRMANADSDAAAIVEAAYGAVAPARPRMCSEDDVASALADLRAGLSAAAQRGNQNQVARQILTQAMDDDDAAMLFVLLGVPAKRTLNAMNVKRLDLLQAYANAKVAKVDYANGARPLRFGQALTAGVPGGAFIALQSTDQALTKLPSYAQEYYQAQLSVAQALMNSSIVKANMR